MTWKNNIERYYDIESFNISHCLLLAICFLVWQQKKCDTACNVSFQCCQARQKASAAMRVTLKRGAEVWRLMKFIWIDGRSCDRVFEQIFLLVVSNYFCWCSNPFWDLQNWQAYVSNWQNQPVEVVLFWPKIWPGHQKHRCRMDGHKGCQAIIMINHPIDITIMTCAMSEMYVKIMIAAAPIVPMATPNGNRCCHVAQDWHGLLCASLVKAYGLARWLRHGSCCPVEESVLHMVRRFLGGCESVQWSVKKTDKYMKIGALVVSNS